MASTDSAARSFDGFGAEVDAAPYPEGDGVPLFVSPKDSRLADVLDDAVAWVRGNAAAITQACIDHGAVVLRGFAIHSTADFNRVVEHLPSTDFGYAGGNTRRNPIEGRVFEATALPKTEKIILHQEMAYLPHFPSSLAFFCLKPSETGGETIICDMRQVESHIDQDFLAKVRKGGVLYLRNFRAPGTTTGYPMLDAYHKTWQEAFYSDDRSVAEEACRKMGLDYEWLPDGSMSTSYHATGFTQHPVTGQEVYFNHVHAMSFVEPTISKHHWVEQEEFYSQSSMIRPFQVRFGDSSPMDPADIRAIYEVLDGLTVAFPWQSGDVMIVDNILTCHGRNPFTGTRDVQVALIR